jgi:type III pantothenate kinase
LTTLRVKATEILTSRITYMKWLALAIGNSRLHWAYFDDQELQQAWHTAYFTPTADWRKSAQPDWLIPANTPLYLASVVPAQTSAWQPFAQRILTLADVPLKGLYPTLGIDRALAALGAGETYGYPLLLIDAGTALTITGINADRQLAGGAIWPGLRLQWQALHQGTATLPDFQPDFKPANRWAMNTAEAIASGILYSTLAGIRDFYLDWQCQFPETTLVITGGDGKILYLSLHSDERRQYVLKSLKHSPDAIFHGISAVYKQPNL